MTEVRNCSAKARSSRRSPLIFQTLLSWSIVLLGLINQVKVVIVRLTSSKEKGVDERIREKNCVELQVKNTT